MNESQLGKSILIIGEFSYSHYEEAWVRSLREIGHTVSSFKIGEYLHGTLGHLARRLLIGPKIRAINEAALRRALAEKPDIIVCYRALQILPSTIERVRKSLPRTRLVCYQNDNIFGELSGKSFWRFFTRAIPLFDLHLVIRESDVENYRKRGARNVHLLRTHFLPWLHRPLPQRGKLEFDIGFFGHCENDRRINFMAALIHGTDLKVTVRGSGWERYSRAQPWEVWETGPVFDEEYVRALNAAKIALCFLSTLNQDSYTRRCFEIPACKTLLLAERTETMRQLYEEDKEAAMFSSAEELIDKALFFARNDSISEKIARAGYDRCLSSGYDIHSKMREWITILSRN